MNEAILDQGFLSEILTYLKQKPNKNQIAKKKIELCRKYGLKKIPTDIELYLNLEETPELKKTLQTKPVRTISGVATIAIMTHPAKCPHGKCTYCPGGQQSYFGDVPQSYTGNEPATMRGIRNNYDPYLQVFNRLEQYIAIGQNPEKAEIIIMGGTFIATNKEYREQYITQVFNALNDFSQLFYEEEFNAKKFKEFFELPGSIKNEERGNRIRKKILEHKQKNKDTLKEAQKKNEDSKIKCVGLTIETKPDQGFKEHGNQMLELGCTRIELGVQTLKDDVLKKVKRGHTLEDTKKSIQELKDLGFKLNFHMMPGLPDTSKEEEKQIFKELFNNEDYKPDMLKIYQLMVMPGTPLHEDYKKGLYKPLNTEDAIKILAEIIPEIPEYCRVMRVQRDIPPTQAEAGVNMSNLRQAIDQEIQKQGKKIKEIRVREIKNQEIKEPTTLNVTEYEASKGKEYFINVEDANQKLLGFLRLRFPSTQLRKEITNKTALIRELHVYGEATAPQKTGITQHRGIGKQLMKKAEQITKEQGKNKIVIISGIGVRKYYEKLGYQHEGPYMTKKI